MGTLGVCAFELMVPRVPSLRGQLRLQNSCIYELLEAGGRTLMISSSFCLRLFSFRPLLSFVVTLLLSFSFSFFFKFIFQIDLFISNLTFSQSKAVSSLLTRDIQEEEYSFESLCFFVGLSWANWVFDRFKKPYEFIEDGPLTEVWAAPIFSLNETCSLTDRRGSVDSESIMWERRWMNSSSSFIFLFLPSMTSLRVQSCLMIISLDEQNMHRFAYQPRPLCSPKDSSIN